MFGSKSMVWVVLTLAVTVRPAIVPFEDDCSKYIRSLHPAFKVNVVFSPPIEMKILPVPEEPMLPEAALRLMLAAGPVVFILAVDAVRVPAVLNIEPAVTVIPTDEAAVVLVVRALAPR